MQCPNCKISCVGCAGAKIVKASNGATVCTRCLTSYETGLKARNGTAPTNAKVTYIPPKQ